MKNMGHYRVCLVGCGRIAQRHAEIIAKNKITNLTLVGVCDLDSNKAKYLGEKYNVNSYVDMDLMIQKENPDIISILNESGNHAKTLFQLAKYKKHFIVEKPMALKIDDAEKMISVCRENGVFLFVVKQNRFNLPIIELKKAIDNKKFGRIHLGTIRLRWKRDNEYYKQASWRGTWLMDGGVLLNQASHHVDMLQWIMGEVKTVQSINKTFLVNSETPDTSISILEFKSGALGIIEATNATRPKDLEGSISILGEYGTVEVGGFAMNRIKTWDFSNEEEKTKDYFNKFSDNPPDVYGFGHISFYESVIRSLKKNQMVSVDGDDGLKTLKLLHAIHCANSSGLKLNFDENPIFDKLGNL